jgi:hypothetical protein
MENNNHHLTKLENVKILDLINKIDNLSETDRNELSKRIVSDDIEIRRSALEKITQSQMAQGDFMMIMGELSALKKEGMYVKTKQTMKTGSGTFEIESKGGDTKLIIPVLIIIAIAAIAITAIVFWQ